MSADAAEPRWYSTLDCARSLGVSDWWVREQIELGRLKAIVIQVGRQKVYKILESDWDDFRALYTGDARDPRFDRS